MDLFFTVDTVTFDKNSQTVMADVRQVLRPKALGGVMSVNMHYILKLQLEQGDNGLYKIVNHLEIHAAQDMISQVPIIGNFYDQSLRNAVGQISLAGSSLLEYTGVLDMLPKAVEKTKGAASALSRGVGSLASGATGIAGSALERTGVSSLLNYAAGYAKYYGSIMIEEGRGEHVDCYVPTCRPGLLCYSPTCPRGKSYQWMTRDAISDIVKGAYSTAAKRAPFLSTHNPK
ncbi:hypothetical protein EDD86DRAFT_208333 [Gorgonomyces haynaldii]|nr:hypothetical protein EDD86DRAFT_208333 [Gorgonomyces haynaldii]